MRFPPTLGQVSLVSLAGLVLALGLVLFGFFQSSREILSETAELLIDRASHEVENTVSSHLRQASDAVARFEEEVQAGLLDPRDPRSLEQALVAELVGHPDLAQATFTWAWPLGPDEDGFMQVEPEGSGQVSAFRRGEEVLLKSVRFREGTYLAETRRLLPEPGPPEREEVKDPTDHPTFRTPSRVKFRGETLWSDLAQNQGDGRTVVTVQQAVDDARGRFAGVLRVGLLTRQVDQVADFRPGGAGREDPHRVFLVTPTWGFITRFAPDDPIREVDGDLRVVPRRIPPEVEQARRDLKLETLGSGPEKKWFGRIMVGGEPYLASFRALEGTQDWIVGITVPESFYLGRMEAIQRRALENSFAAVLFIALLGYVVLRAIQRDLGRLVAESVRMQNFDFTAGRPLSRLRDTAVVADSLEATKTAMRTLSKYAPVELVRRLFQENREPHLGGELRDVTLMFTDIEGFSSIAERLPIDELARLLAVYLEEMNAAVGTQQGTVLERVGDALLVSWNAPTEQEDHARLACEVALACREVGAHTRFRTRVGLHTDRVMVGHFGARDRMNYGVMGDGVNLAARLESLNKQYGTTILASSATVEAAGPGFVFRKVDCVAVKGRVQGIDVYELMGREGEVSDDTLRLVRRYEGALVLYREGRFTEARELFESLPRDEPAAVMAERCRKLKEEPPGPDWSGVYVARSK